MNQLTIGGIFNEGIKIGLNNAVALIVNGILWLLTIWIPYLNVGTTIGMISLAAKMARSEGVSMTEIFNPEYRRFMGEFFLVLTFFTIGMYAGIIFLVIPGYVIAIAWSLAPLLVVDRGMDPIAAIKKSNELTYGNKWIIFGGGFLLYIVLLIAAGILVAIGNAIHPYIGLIFVLAAVALIMSIMIGAQAYIYKTLTANA